MVRSASSRVSNHEATMSVVPDSNFKQRTKFPRKSSYAAKAEYQYAADYRFYHRGLGIPDRPLEPVIGRAFARPGGGR
jgi:hypothetical protein